MSSAGAKRQADAGPGELLPVIQLSSSVVFPFDVVSIQLQEGEALPPQGLEDETTVLAVYPRRSRSRAPSLETIFPVGVVCRVVQRIAMPQGAVQAVFQGQARAVIRSLHAEGASVSATVDRVPHETDAGGASDRAVLEILDLLHDYLPRDGTYPEDLETILRMNLRGPGRFADLVAAYLHLPLPCKREILASEDPTRRLGLVRDALQEEISRWNVDSDVQKKVRTQIEQRQKEQYLRQQMRVIRRELGEEESGEGEGDELMERLARARLPREARDVAEREIRRLRSVPVSSAEYQVIRTYVGWLLDLPWRRRSRDRHDLKEARRILDARHAALPRMKERILEHLAVRCLKPDQRGPVLCLVGPPGVGKTSLGRSVAEALGRKFVRMSVGGLRDEAEIKGHRRTYVGAMPGKVIQLLKRAGTKNPVLQIDEVDKMGSDFRGDPASAILEVLDSEVNFEFRDHYLDVGFDLSQVIFLATANLVDPIPAALRDRLEIVRIEGYTREEKVAIARGHMIPRAMDANGLQAGQMHFTPAGLGALIDGHTREAGLREMDRKLHAVCRKVATRRVQGETAPVTVGKRRLSELLGPAPYRNEAAGRSPEVGVVTGLAWTSVGGTLLTIEATRMPGRGAILVTGHLGEVMQESARAALSYVRSNCEEFEIAPGAFRKCDIHIHFPEGATPKDGPSAGVAIATCVASLFTGRAARSDLAMTGEITLKGRVLDVGGIKEKLLAAYRAGLRTVLIPKGNVPDLAEVPPEVRRSMEIVPTEDVMQNICEALLSIVVAQPADLDEVVAEQPAMARPVRPHHSRELGPR
ncbi:MAG: endopeptidase La [Planctomycetaceae bacterium]